MHRNHHQDHFERIRRRQYTDAFRIKRQERSWKVEGIFGEAKKNHCLGRARYRGLEKVQIQLYLSAFVQNIKRIIGVYGEAASSFLAYLVAIGSMSDLKTLILIEDY